MNTVERVKSICKERKIPISKLEADCGFANGYIGQLRKGTFPDDRLKIISEYLDISIDYLLSGEEREIIVESAKENAKLISLSSRIKEYALKLAELPKEKQDQIISLIDMLENKKEE